MYQLPTLKKAQKGNELGIFEEQSWLDSVDMNKFYQYVTPHIPNGTYPKFEGIDGATDINNTTFGGGEAALDFQVAIPLIYPQGTIVYQTDDDHYQTTGDFGGFFNTFLDAIDGSYCNYTTFGETGDSSIDPQYPDNHPDGYKGKLQCRVYKPTNVISLSYGIPELDFGIPANYQQHQCNEYMKLGMQGVSIVFASGDAGVNDCLSKSRVFDPLFPANCPYVTAVGATYLPRGASVTKDEERATDEFGSGGGFSNFFARPTYQNAAVKSYFSSPAAPNYSYYTGPDMGKDLYNRSGRATPDISANGQGFVTFSQGEPGVSGGTSQAAPIFASILTLINEERLAAGKSPVGFVNPVLYQNPQAFHDITKGNNPGCHKKGFNATTGWDPVTGLGTPIYPALLAAFMKAGK